MIRLLLVVILSPPSRETGLGFLYSMASWRSHKPTA